ncbi:MAG: hypothetical protein JNM79_23415 [Burkholderiales bacterium]|nr:hypothetical protein [Burkholderiales bacterium]
MSIDATAKPGRTCPLAYRYGAAALDRVPDLLADSLYVVGGMYGNPFALDALDRLLAREPGAQAVFNGDFNWFDIDDTGFTRVNRAVLRHHALRGNVETELLADDAAAGCGCGYPDHVGDADVARSNAIMSVLAATARRQRELSESLAALPMHLVAQVGDVRVGIVHGDADSLAGWSFGEESIDAATVRAMFDAARVRVFASSHTCLPVAQVFDAAAGRSVLINNGAAGMPNFAGTDFGVITRIAVSPAPPWAGALYGTRVDGIFIDALPLHYDSAAWLKHFDHLWPAGSPAALSYRRRIVAGPGYAFARAPRAGIDVYPASSAASCRVPLAA